MIKSYLHPIEKAEIYREERLDSPDFDRFVAFDIETTGLSRTDSIIELGAVLVAGGKRIKEMNTLVRPRHSIPSLVEEITGITNIMVAHAPKPEDTVLAFLDFIGNDILLGHNIAAFDCKFIANEAANIGKQVRNPLFDTLTYARRLRRRGAYLPDKLTLASLVDFFGIAQNTHHRALDDAIANIEVFKCLKALDMTPAK